MHGIEGVGVLDDPVVPRGDVNRLVDDGREDMVRRRDTDDGDNDDGGEQGELGAAGHADHLIASRIFTSLQTRISYTAPFFHNSRCIVAEVFMVRTFTSFLVVAALMSPELSAQQPPLPPEVG